MPVPGTYDFEGSRTLLPALFTPAAGQPVTTLGNGGTLTITVASDEELCGAIDVATAR